MRPSQTENIQESTRVLKIGRALYVSIPVRVTRLLGIEKGHHLAVTVEGESIRLARVDMREVVATARRRISIFS